MSLAIFRRAEVCHPAQRFFLSPAEFRKPVTRNKWFGISEFVSVFGIPSMDSSEFSVGSEKKNVDLKY